MKTFSRLMKSIALTVVLSLSLFAKEASAQSYILADYYGDTYYQESPDPEYVASEEPQFEYIQAPTSPVEFIDRIAQERDMTTDLYGAAYGGISREGSFYDPNVASDVMSVVDYVSNMADVPQLTGEELYKVIGGAYQEMVDLGTSLDESVNLLKHYVDRTLDERVVEPAPTGLFFTRVEAPVSPTAFYDEMASMPGMTTELWDAMRNISRESGRYDPNVGSDLFTVARYVAQLEAPQLSGQELYDVIGSTYWQMNDDAVNGIGYTPQDTVAVLLSNTERVLSNR